MTNRERIEELNRRRDMLRKRSIELGGKGSLEDEIGEIDRLTGYLSRADEGNATWALGTASDGYTIDTFQQENYENCLGRLNGLQQENAEYITQEYIDNFTYDQLDDMKLAQLRAEFLGAAQEPGIYMETYLADLKNVLDNNVLENPVKDELYRKLIEGRRILRDYNLQKAQEAQEAPNKEEGQEVEADKPVAVNESKFKQIYGKAKDKIQEVMAKIKGLFRNKTEQKENMQNDIDEEQK